MTQKSAKSIILYLLGIKSYSVDELRKKLTLRGLPSDQIEKALRECQEMGYLNDQEEAIRRVASLKNRGYGPYWIREKMRKAGLEPSQITQEDQVKAIQSLNARPSFAKKERRKKIAALQRRGFDLDAIFSAKI